MSDMSNDTPANDDPVNPRHYTTFSPQPIEVIEAWGLGFCLGNAVKYICRAGKKGSPLEDLRKAAWYLNRKIERLRVEQDRLAKEGEDDGRPT
jgi:hypothetical protein